MDDINWKEMIIDIRLPDVIKHCNDDDEVSKLYGDFINVMRTSGVDMATFSELDRGLNLYNSVVVVDRSYRLGIKDAAEISAAFSSNNVV